MESLLIMAAEEKSAQEEKKCVDQKRN